MNTITIEPLEYRLRETFNYHYNGNILKNNNAKDIIVNYPCNLTINKHRIKFLVRSTMSKESIGNVKDYLHIVFKNSEGRLKDYLKSYDTIDVFSILELRIIENRFNIKAKDISNNNATVLEINEILYDNIMNSAIEYENIQRTIQEVLKKLTEYAFELNSTGHEYYKNEMLTYWRFIKDCFENAYNYLGFNHREYLSDIYIAINELARRKIEDNFNYKSHKDTFKKRIFGLHSPEIWITKPLIPEEIYKKFGEPK